MSRLSLFAWFSGVVHVAGLAFAWLMCPGTALVSLPARMNWLAQDPLVWKLGWMVWMVAALCVGGFYALLSERLGRPALGVWAVGLGCAGAGIDVFSEVIYINVLPQLAQTGNRELFVAFESAAMGGGCIVANGFYTLGLALMALALKRAGRASFWLDLSAAMTVSCGAIISVAGVLQSAVLLEFFTGPTILGFSLWCILAAGRAR